MIHFVWEVYCARVSLARVYGRALDRHPDVSLCVCLVVWRHTRVRVCVWARAHCALHKPYNIFYVGHGHMTMVISIPRIAALYSVV